MTAEPRPRIPAALLLGLILALATAAVYVVLGLVRGEWYMGRVQLGNEGVDIAADFLLMSGTFVLARRLAGPEALGARLVGWLMIVRLAMVGLWAVANCYLLTHHDSSSLYADIFAIMRWVDLALAVALAIGWILAAGGFARRLALAIPTLLLAFVLSAPAVIAEPLFKLVGAGAPVHSALHAGLAALVLVLGILAARGAREVSAPELASNGLRLAASALWLRVIAAISIASLTLLLVGAGARDAQGMMKVVMMLGQAVNILALVRFGHGALLVAGSDSQDLPRWPFALGGAMSVWAASVMVMQVPWLFESLYGEHSSWGTESAQLFAVALPLVSAAGIVFVVIGISGVASRRSLSEISERAGSRGAAFVALTLASVMIQTLVRPSVSTLSGFVLASLGIAIASFVAIVQVAKLCSATADQLELAPGIPKAIVRLSDQP